MNAALIVGFEEAERMILSSLFLFSFSRLALTTVFDAVVLCAPSFLFAFFVFSRGVFAAPVSQLIEDLVRIMLGANVVLIINVDNLKGLPE